MYYLLCVTLQFYFLLVVTGQSPQGPVSISLGGSSPRPVLNTKSEEEHMRAILNPANLPPQ